MAELAVSERRDLIADYVDKAKINWAHIGVAQLIKYGYVDRVLTTNFDLLVARACALVGLFPAVYDFATSQLYKPADITDEAIIPHFQFDSDLSTFRRPSASLFIGARAR